MQAKAFIIDQTLSFRIDRDAVEIVVHLVVFALSIKHSQYVIEHYVNTYPNTFVVSHGLATKCHHPSLFLSSFFLLL